VTRTRKVVADDDGVVRGDEEEVSDDDFFDASEGAVIPDHLSLRAASESGQSESGSGTEDDPDGPVTPSVANTNTLPHNNKPSAVDFSRTISSDSTDLDNKKWVDPTPIQATPLDPAPPAFLPPIITKTKLSSTAKIRRGGRPDAHISHATRTCNTCVPTTDHREDKVIQQH
jgi:hypothetical protein